MGGFFGGGAKAPEPDNSYMDKQLELQKEQKDQLERENQARRRNLRSRSSGGSSLRFTGDSAAPATTDATAGTGKTLGG
ncbi:hypothetical protein [Magnetospirillum sulfuroxidans]|uniref:Uncharacterized protein n=1 Tax=Magnetospirillum sulfuroxidans TaxID=611300 RepID=A0ABS5I8Q3_9PROT|nr:hypothetical protein [Magnetospirillum sulfuroxidans]MBR9970817.1 hypothetical protein [Magnetospirillum sulfuroxidans]